jgi:NADP-dependent 3-hydroxy acid dehydrogenase YdfG
MNRRDHKVCVIAGATQGLGAAITRDGDCERIEGVRKALAGETSGAKK